MARTPTHSKLILTAEENQYLNEVRQSRTATARDAQRAQILWRYHTGATVTQIVRALRITRKTALKWIDGALQVGVKTGVADTPHKSMEAGPRLFLLMA